MQQYRSGHNEHDWKSCVRQKRTESSNLSCCAKKNTTQQGGVLFCIQRFEQGMSEAKKRPSGAFSARLHRRGITIDATCPVPSIVPLPRKRLTFSATGSVSPLSESRCERISPAAPNKTTIFRWWFYFLLSALSELGFSPFTPPASLLRRGRRCERTARRDRGPCRSPRPLSPCRSSRRSFPESS